VTQRTKLVCVTFVAAMTVVIGLLMLRGSGVRGGYVLASLETVNEPAAQSHATEAIFQTAVPLDRQRWTGIVIHHLGEPAGDADSVHRKHLALGLNGLGYHFLIGNGNGLGDGVIHVGYRWTGQLPGAHVQGSQGSQHNQHSIAICLVGNGDRRPFADRELDQLVRLVQRLQNELGIDHRNVHLHRDLFAQTTSPGRFFGEAWFRQQLLDRPTTSVAGR
jgi:N-acetyl-anhydromuramyl-L-alanine amidase AmpD